MAVPLLRNGTFYVISVELRRLKAFLRFSHRGTARCSIFAARAMGLQAPRSFEDLTGWHFVGFSKPCSAATAVLIDEIQE
jgi:hypothetical protein